MRKPFGFTLIEVLIALMISAIIASIAYPGYVTYMLESRRGDALTALIANQQIVEDYMLNNTSGSIPTIAQIQGTSFALLSPKGFYAVTYCVDNGASPTLYFIVATTSPSTSAALGTCIDITGQTLTSTVQSNDTGCTKISVHSQFNGIFPATCK